VRAEHVKQVPVPAYAPPPAAGVVPNPYDTFHYDTWPDELWESLFVLDQEAYWYHFMLWRMATWTGAEWEAFATESPEIYAYITGMNEHWRVQVPGGDLYSGPSYAPVPSPEAEPGAMQADGGQQAFGYETPEPAGPSTAQLQHESMSPHGQERRQAAELEGADMFGERHGGAEFAEHSAAANGAVLERSLEPGVSRDGQANGHAVHEWAHSADTVTSVGDWRDAAAHDHEGMQNGHAAAEQLPERHVFQPRDANAQVHKAAWDESDSAHLACPGTLHGPSKGALVEEESWPDPDELEEGEANAQAQQWAQWLKDRSAQLPADAASVDTSSQVRCFVSFVCAWRAPAQTNWF
jgi:hypothetical protein